MTRNDLFTEQKNLLMHLSSIGSVGVVTNLSAEIAFGEQQVQEVTLDLVPEVDNETILMVKEARLEVGSIDFKTGQVVFVPTGIEIKLAEAQR